jgi:hypothetical protein
MHPEAISNLKTAISRSLPLMQELASRLHEPQLLWRREGNGWRGEWVQKPNLVAVLGEARRMLAEHSLPFAESFRRHHADHAGMVGVGSHGTLNLLHDPAYIVGCALGTLWQRHETFECRGEEVDAIVEEFSRFVDRAEVGIRFWAQLLNFRADADRIELPRGLAIRRLSEQEVSRHYGGPAWQLGMRKSRRADICEFVIEGEYQERKVLGQLEPPQDDPVRDQLNRAVLALRTFKEGPVGYDTVHREPIGFCPSPLGSLIYGDLYVPFGVYQLSAGETTALRRHAEKLFTRLDPSMEMACSRLSDAQVRLRPEDRLIDAVIGLEALLLAALSSEDRRGELSYRFSLHYSTLFDSPQRRHAAYKVAKDLYGLRSTIAHGNPAKRDEYRVGAEHMPLAQAATRAIEVLRQVVHHFLGVDGAPYKQMSYWEHTLFLLPPPRG